jgi:hypothetical protein
VRAQLERLDARVSTLEHGATAPAEREFQPAAAARERRLTLLDLSSDALHKVVTYLDPDDELAASLACHKLRDALRAARSSAGERTALQTRVRSLLGSLGTLQWGVAYAGAPLSQHLAALVARLGDVRMLSWLRARGCPWPGSEGVRLEGGGPCAMAAKGGHLVMLQWLHANGCSWDEWTCSSAAGGGHLFVLQLLHANGCPWDEYTCSEAARGGHLSVLQWARANGCPWEEQTCASAARGGHLSVLQWLHANGCPWDEETCASAAEGGHLAVLQWARANGCSRDKRM